MEYLYESLVLQGEWLESYGRRDSVEVVRPDLFAD